MKKILTSRKWTAYVLTLIGLVAMTALKAPVEVAGYVGQAIAFGLPVLLGGQAYVDSKAVAPPESKAEA